MQVTELIQKVNQNYINNSGCQGLGGAANGELLSNRCRVSGLYEERVMGWVVVATQQHHCIISLKMVKTVNVTKVFLNINKEKINSHKKHCTHNRQPNRK